MPYRTLKIFRRVALCFIVGFAAVQVAVAQTGPITAQEDGANRVNIAGRQRMLSQRMAKAACYVDLGIETQAHLDMLRTAQNEFSGALFGLRFGSVGMRILPPKDGEVERAFAPVVAEWLGFSRAVDQVLSDPTDRAALDVIRQRNDDLLELSDDAVLVMEHAYGAGEISEEMARTINIAGRQRMLSQRMAKGFCEVSRNPNNLFVREEFFEAIDVFATSHSSLLLGDPLSGILPPPSAEVNLQLVLVDDAWRTIQTHFELAAAGVVPEPEEVDRVGRYSETLLFDMNKAVGLYAKAQNGSS